MKHMTGTRRDEKIARLIAAGGKDGIARYGLYWMVQEIIADQMEGLAPSCTVTYPVGVWAKMLSSHPPQVLKQLSWLVHAGLMEMSCEGQEITMTNVKLLKYRDEYSKKSRHSPDRLRTKEGDIDTEGEQKEQKPSPTPTEKPVVAEDLTEPPRLVPPPLKSPKPPKEPKPPKPAKPKEPKHSTDPRHIACKEEIFAYYRLKNGGEDPDWDGREGGALGKFLGANPKLTSVGIRRLLTCRAQSEVNHSERPAVWVPFLKSYLGGPLNQFNRPLNGTTNGKPKPVTMDDMKYVNTEEEVTY